jgi:ABC-type multidrug transport system fused ATPase/permease subunit
MSKLPQIAGLEPKSLDAIKRAIREMLVPRWRMYLLSILFMVGAAGFTAALAYSTKLIVNDIFVDDNPGMALWVAFIVIGVSVGKGVSQYSANVIAEQFVRRISADYQRQIFRKLMHRPVPEFTGIHPSRFMSQITTFGRATGQAVVTLSCTILMDLMSLVALVTVMIVQDPMMTLGCAFLFPLIFWLVGKLTSRVRGLARAEADMTGQVNAVGIEAIQGIKTVKSYGLEAKSYDRFRQAVDGLEDQMIRIARARHMTVPIMEVLGGLTIGIFVIYASWQTLANGKTPGEFTAFITAFLLAYQPAERISNLMVALNKDLVQAEQMFALLDAPEPRTIRGGASLKDRQPEIVLQDVSFDYGGDSPAIKGVSATIRAGERVAIVGRSGAGKTTLIDLIQGFYAPSTGTITLGGVPLNTLPAQELRRNIALISQEVFLFDGTIRENIRDGNPAATDAQIEDAARRAAVTSFADKMPLGLDSPIGAGGASLSGGQKQRIGIARALAKHAKLYIFDEATSALDGENERAIMASTLGAEKGSTTLFITHRPSTLEWVDRIMVMEDGELVGFDSHEELVKTSAAYRTLFNLAQQAEDKPRSRLGGLLSTFFRASNT